MEPIPESKIDMERTIVRLQNEVSDIVLNLSAARQELIEINGEIKGKRLEQSRYDKLCRRQVQLKSDIAEYDRQIAGRKQRIRVLSVEKGAPDRRTAMQLDADGVLVTKLRTLRDRYAVIGRDQTRLPAVQSMADQFVEALNEIILKHVRDRESRI